MRNEAADVSRVGVIGLGTGSIAAYAKAHDQSVRDLKLFFILEEIAEQRDIVVGDETLNSAIAQIAQRTNKRFDRVRDELSKGEGLNVLYHKLRDQQVLDDLLGDAEVSDKEAPKKTSMVEPKTKKAASPEKAKVEKEPATSATVKKRTAKKPAAKKSTKRSS